LSKIGIYFGFKAMKAINFVNTADDAAVELAAVSTFKKLN